MIYFAYGSNMDPVHMRGTAPGARALGVAHLAGWRLTFTSEPGAHGGVPHIERDPGDQVWGVLWDATDADLAALDEYEGTAYVRGTVAVSHEGRVVEAIVYFATPGPLVAPSKRLLAMVIAGAEAHGLPAAYVERLRSLIPEGGSRRPRGPRSGR